MNLDQIQQIYETYIGTALNAREALDKSGKYSKKKKKPSKYNPDGSLTHEYIEWEKENG